MYYSYHIFYELDFVLIIGAVLHWLSTVKITKTLSNVDGKQELNMYTGHSAKFQFILEGGYKALFKVKRYGYETVYRYKLMSLNMVPMQSIIHIKNIRLII